MSDAVHRLVLTGEQLFAERVHLNLASPVIEAYVRKQRVGLWIIGGAVLLLGALTAVLVPLSAGGEPVPQEVPVLAIAGIVLGLVLLGYATFMPRYYGTSVTALERKFWAYVGDDGAHLELSPAGVALDAPGRTVRTGWAYYDDVAVVDAGLELRRRGGPVAFYPIETFGSEPTMWRVADDVRAWIAAQR